jgi:ATP-dependent Lon protease
MDSRHKPARRTTTTYGRAAAELPTPISLLDGEDANPPDEQTLILPILPVRDTVILPNMVVPLFIEQPGALSAVEAAMAVDRTLVAVAQRDNSLSNPRKRDLHTIGTQCTIERMLRMPDGSHNVMLQGQRRVRVGWWLQQTPFGQARVTPHEEVGSATSQVEALRRTTLALLERCTKLGGRLTEDAYVQALNIALPGTLADYICAQLEPALTHRQEVLETFDAGERLRKVCRLMSAELEVLELERKIQDEVQQEIDRGQREYYLREQLKAIQRELGEHDPAMRDSLDLREAILARRMPADVEARALKELQRLEGMPSMTPEHSVLRTYLDWLVALPWQERTTDAFDLRRVAETLDAHHFGLERVKDRVIEYLAVRKLAPSGRAPILCLAGPPGVGKTSLGRSIAESLGRKFVRLSVGGVRDEAEVRGHRRTYVGALPGRILQAMKAAGVRNPVFVLDEIDKLASDFRGDPAAAMLEVLDPEQNATFSDHYLEVPYDLSQVFFVLTANVITSIPGPLRDRMEVIEIAGYTEEEKLHIARRFLIPRQMEDAGLSPLRVAIDDEAVRRIIRDYTFEAGVRSLEREIGSVMRKVARRVVEGRRHKALVTESRVTCYLGPQRHYSQDAAEHDEIGAAVGLAWTAAGGELTTVEVMAVPGHGAVALTGQLGDVMKESAHAALTYVRGRAESLRLEADFHERTDLHVHLPSGAIPKDGPSAGITMATAIVSALTGRSVRRDVAMTGEVTLRGRVLPVGGIKEKVLAAHRSGIRTVLLPSRNLRDLDEIPEEVREGVRLVPIDTMDQVIAEALLPERLPMPAQPPTPAPHRAPHPPLTISAPIAAASRTARPRARRVVAVAP